MINWIKRFFGNQIIEKQLLRTNSFNPRPKAKLPVEMIPVDESLISYSKEYMGKLKDDNK